MIVKATAITKKNKKFDDGEIEAFIKILYQFFEEISATNNVSKRGITIKMFGNINYLEENYNTHSLYKFIPESVYTQFISKGKFQLGSLEYYREIENEMSKDDQEGYSNIILDNGNQQFIGSVISGFNYYIFCASQNLKNSDFMKNKFGGYLMKIKNVNSFAEKIKKAIGAKSWKVRKIFYSDFKPYKQNVHTSFDGLESNFNEKIFNHLLQISELPSVFGKPLSFKTEQEIRIAFDMGRSVKRKRLNFTNLGLLDEIEIRKV